MKRKNLRLLALVVLLAATATAPLAAAQPVNERHQVAPGAEVSIENIAGSLTISAWEQPEVEITGTLGDGVEGIEVSSDEEGIEIEVKYEGYIRIQMREIERFKHLEKRRLPDDFDYATVHGLSNELRQKLTTVRPSSLGQAARIDGMTPAALAVLLVALKARGR